MTLSSLPSKRSAIVAWLTGDTRPDNQPKNVVQGLCSQLVTAGLVV